MFHNLFCIIKKMLPLCNLSAKNVFSGDKNMRMVFTIIVLFCIILWVISKVIQRWVGIKLSLEGTSVPYLTC